MDAQNAAQSDQTRPAVASPQLQGPQPETTSSPAPAPATAPLSPRPVSPGKDSRDPKDAKDNKEIKDAKEARPSANPSAAPDLQPAADDRDSDAETIVLPGKDGHSPSKIRKVRQEDKSDGDGDAPKALPKAAPAPHDADKPSVTSRLAEGTIAVKKKRLSSHIDREKQPRSKDASSGLSSAPASPPRRRRRSDGPRSSSDSEPSHPRPPKSTLRDKLKPGERLLPHKRKGPSKADSDDEAEGRKARRQRTTSAGLDSSRLLKDKPLAKSRYEARNRSISPHVRSHRRSISSQLPSNSLNGVVQKKKRVPPALNSTEYHSDDSSVSGSSHARHFKHRGLAHPSSADNQVSPAKLAPHKKHLDAHGQTLLARACARGEYDGAKQRLGERPEDLNVADYAGNTPLQIAAINGCEDIVKLLIDAGCNLDCVNYDKDTPLLDAVDNGHLGVVKLLLEAGVNPRKANVNGEEPIDRVSDETENAEEIRAALLDARKRQGDRRRTSEDRHSHHEHETRDSHAPESPRQSPAALLPGASGRRSGTVRSTKTRNDLLYMPLDEKTLRQAAGRGDEETVARILQVKEGFDDPESMVAAARGGHDLVIQLLLGLGGASPDPAPIAGAQSEFGTPILAAIGQENIKVVELLLEQQGFDPTRRFKGETYYEIARRRQGTNWKEEEHMLKNAYDEHKRSHSTKTKSPNRRERERDREERESKRAKRAEAKEEARLQKRNLSSPSRDPEPKKKLPATKLSSPKEKRRADSFNQADDKRGPGRLKKDDRGPTINVSDREISPTLSHKHLKTKRSESDPAATGASSEGESVKPRRKLVSKGELKGRGEREKHRRASMVSNASSLKDHPSSPHESRTEEPSEKHGVGKLSEKYHDRTKALKRDESRDRLSVSGDGSAKRHRASITPDRPNNGDRDDSEVPTKRRRLEGEAKEKRSKILSSDERPRKSKSSDSSAKVPSRPSHKSHDEDRREGRLNTKRRDSARSSSAEKMIHVKSEEVDIEMGDADSIKSIVDADTQAARDREAEKEKQRLLEQEEAKKKEEERKRIEAEEKEKERKKKREQEEARVREEQEKQKKEEEDRKRKEEEAREAERKKKEEEDRKRREEEERLRLEAEDKVRREEEERQRKLQEEKKKEEEERKAREEEERLRQEQLEREAAAEEARRQREEEQKERERRERAHREEMERKRAAREAEQKRIREEQERIRLDKLPPLLRWLDMSPNPKLPAVATAVMPVQGVRYDTINPQANNTPEGREQWVLNTHVALLLGEKDLNLSRYTAWERVPATTVAKRSLWRVEWKIYSLQKPKLWDMGLQLPNYYGDEKPDSLLLSTKTRLKNEAWERFLNTDMFFVKLSDLLYTIPNIPHLRNVELAVTYRELLESEAELLSGHIPNKWKQDPDIARFHGFSPRFKWYVNGAMVKEELPQPARISKTPFPEKRVPRRGLNQVYPEDPEYQRICIEQGFEYLLNGQASPAVNGVHSSPVSQTSATPSKSTTNGVTKALAAQTAAEGAVDGPPTVNGGPANGVNGSSN